ncbi:Sphingomyelin phosphodiesterase 2-like protein [Cladobotryum mycophilum]|uniref:Sphingomyelin phosphodiesterase 2-like protein n=1 Tax=Cladobotryum mycophilum TaxID=491253 RepID=A0ABR0SPK8_9HYPO
MHFFSVPSLLPLLVLSSFGSRLVFAVSDSPVLGEHELVQRSLETREWAIQTRGLLDDFSTCNGCQNIISVLKGLVQNGDSALISLGKQLCTSGTSFDEEFCDGVLQREGPIIADIVRTMDINSTSSIQFCIAFFGVCERPAVAQWSIPFPTKKPCNSKRPEPSGKDPLKIVHYSDIHIDPLYVTGSSTQCKKPTCCRPYTEDDEPGKTKFPAGPNGDHGCDVPISLEDSMYKAIKEMFPDQAFTIFTGDIVDHSIFNTSKTYNLGEIEHAYGKMSDNFKLVYGTAGNHESDPANIFKPKSLRNDTQWVYDALSNEWSNWIGVKATGDVKSIGAYSTKYPKGNLRVISLNTNMYYRFNFVLYQKTMEQDPDGQIDWLVKELDAAEKAGENVYIIGHMPFGEIDALTDQSNYLDQVVKRYSSTIRAMFFGHTHVDHFEISYSDYSNRAESNALAISYICPSLTPTSGMPSFRVYDVDPDTFAQFSEDWPRVEEILLSQGSIRLRAITPVTDPKAELTPAFWHKVTDAFGRNETLFDDYMARKSRGWMADKKCRDTCQKDEICQLRAGRSQDNCFVPTPGVHFSKRDEVHNHGEHDDCGVSVPREIFHALAARQDLLELLQDRFLAEGAKVPPYKRAESVQSTASTSQTTAEPTETEECVATTITPTGTAASVKPTSTGGASGAGSVGVLGMLALGLLAL